MSDVFQRQRANSISFIERDITGQERIVETPQVRHENEFLIKLALFNR
jgi:hypothetical protein